MAKFDDKIVLVTGASSGIGWETSLLFANKKAHVIAIARREDLLESLYKKIKKDNGQITIIKCDVTDQQQVNQTIKRVLDQIGCPDILVNNAGIIEIDTVINTDISKIKQIMNTNYFGMVYMTKGLLPHMVQRESGHIVNVASLAASFGLPMISAYCASKSAMLGFSEGLRHELLESGIGVTVVSPIMVRTGFVDKSGYALSPQSVAKAILRASNSPRAEITVPTIARAGVIIKHAIPFLTDSIIAKVFRKSINK